MRGLGRYTIIIYLVLFLAVVFMAVKGNAAELADDIDVNVKDSVAKGFTDITIECHGKTFYSTVRTSRLKESIKKLEDWADGECNGGKK